MSNLVFTEFPDLEMRDILFSQKQRDIFLEHCRVDLDRAVHDIDSMHKKSYNELIEMIASTVELGQPIDPEALRQLKYPKGE